MSVYKRSNSRYYYCELSVPGTNRKIIRSTKTTNKSLARRFEHQLRESMYRQHYLGEILPITIADAIQRYHDQQQHNIKHRNLKTIINALSTQLARVTKLDNDLHTLQTSDLLHLLHLRREDGVSDGTIVHLFQSIKGMIACISEEYLVPVGLKYPKLKLKNDRTRILTPSEEDKLLNHLSLHCHSDHLLLVTMLLDSGARLNEVQQMTWDQIDLNCRRITLWRHRTRSETVIKMTERVYESLSKKYTKGVEGLIFPNINGEKKSTTPKAILNAYKKVGLDNFCTHNLRHTAASKLIRKGMSLYEVSKILGHSSIATTQRYAHIEAESVAEKAAKILGR